MIFENSIKILIDPCFRDNPVCPIGPEDIEDVDLILVTHGARDHLGDTIEIAKRTGSRIICDHAVRVHAVRNGIPRDKIMSMMPGGTRELSGIRIKGVEATHISFIESNDSCITGVPLGYLVSANKGIVIYHAGDTSLSGHLKLLGQLYRPNIALVPIGSAYPNGIVEMDNREATIAVQWLAPDIAIPMHYSVPKDAELFADIATSTSPSVRVIIMKPGEQYEFDKILHVRKTRKQQV